MAIIYDLLELDSAPVTGNTIGPAGSGSDVSFLATETNATVADDGYDSSGGLTHQAGLYQGSSGTQPAEIGGIAHDVTHISEVVYALDGSNHTGHVIEVTPIGGGAARQFFLPEDNTDPTLGTVTILSSTTVYFVDADTFATDDTVKFVTCFLAGTRVETPEGPRAVETLGIGDRVATLDHGNQPVLWIGETRVPANHAIRNPHLRPVVIPAGSFGPGRPVRPVCLSRQHRVLLRSPIAARMFGRPEVLIAVKYLEPAGIRPATVVPSGDLVFLHLLLPRHAVLLCEGIGAESLLLGPQARDGLGLAAVDAALAALSRHGVTADFTPARPIVSGARARRLITRHLCNRRPLDHGASAREPA